VRQNENPQRGSDLAKKEEEESVRKSQQRQGQGCVKMKTRSAVKTWRKKCEAKEKKQAEEERGAKVKPAARFGLSEKK
jgi:hypothetical protein